MKKVCILKKFMASLVVLLVLFSQPAKAQASFSSMISAINSVRADIDSLVNLALSYIFQTPPNVGNELVTNNSLHTAVQGIAENVTTLNSQDIQNGLAPNTQNPNANLITLSTIQASDTVLPTLTMGGLPVPFLSGAVQQNMQNSLTQGNSNFDFQSLVTPLVYNSQNMQNFALNFIRFSSGWAVPISNINLAKIPESQLSLKQKLAIQTSADFQAYSVSRRQLISQQSAALTILYGIYSRRLPNTNITAGDTGLGTANPSVAQIEDYNATWRTSSPSWYTQMSTASPANVQKEILFLLAEMQLEIHRMHMENERLLALTALNQLNGLQTAKKTLALDEKRVQDTINQQARANAAQGGTTTNQSQGNQPPPQQKAAAERLKDTQSNANPQTNAVTGR